MRKGSLGIGFSLLLVSTLFPVSLWAQESAEPSWESLRQLRVGQKVQVVEMNLNTLNGTVPSYSEEAIGLRTAKGVVRRDRARGWGGRPRPPDNLSGQEVAQEQSTFVRGPF